MRRSKQQNLNSVKYVDNFFVFAIAPFAIT